MWRSKSYSAWTWNVNAPFRGLRVVSAMAAVDDSLEERVDVELVVTLALLGVVLPVLPVLPLALLALLAVVLLFEVVLLLLTVVSS